MYKDEAIAIEKMGVESGIHSLLHSSTLASFLNRGCNEYELKKELVPKLEDMLNQSKKAVEKRLELAEEAEHSDKKLEQFIEDNEFNLLSIEKAIKRYSQGRPITINSLNFCNADKAPEDKINYKMFPHLNLAGNSLFYTGAITYFPAFPIYWVTGDPTLVQIGFTLIAGGFGLKFINKAVKNLLKKQPGETIWNSAVGMGGLAIADPTKYLLTGVPYVGQYCALLFNVNLFYKFFRTIFSREKIKDKLSPLEEVTKDFEAQIKRYNILKEKYKDINLRKLTKKDFIKEIKSVNKYLKHYLKNIKLKNIDVDIDNIIGKLLGAAARADPFTDTAEFAIKSYRNEKGENTLTAALFAKIYCHEVMHLDGVMNEGQANYLAGKVLEDLAIYRPNQSYDLQLERDKLMAVGHTYALLKLNKFLSLRKEGVDKKDYKKFSRKYLQNELKQKGLKEDDIKLILGWTYPGKVRKGLFRVQSIIGGSNPKGGYTVDHYKLMKRDTTFVY